MHLVEQKLKIYTYFVLNGERLLVKFGVFCGHEVDFYKNKLYGIAFCLSCIKTEIFSKILEKYGVKRERFKRVNLHKNQCKINFDSENAVGGNVASTNFSTIEEVV